MENEEQCPPPDDLLSNMHNQSFSLVKEAIKQSGFDLRIDPIARNDHDGVMPDYFALYTNQRDRDHGPFWELLEQLEEQEKSTARAISLTELQELEWSGNNPCEGTFMGDPRPLHKEHPACPICGGLGPNQPGDCLIKSAFGHHPTCFIKKLLVINK